MPQKREATPELGRLGLPQRTSGTRERVLEAFVAKRLDEVVNRVNFERAHRKLVESGDKNDGGRGCGPKGAQHPEPIDFRHLNVEKQQFGAK
jgi:hypothetical protein